MRQYLLLLFIVSNLLSAYPQAIIRNEIPLTTNWHTIANDTNANAYIGFEQLNYNAENWILTDVPHNWDQYEGYRRLKHGNRHGYAWYRKTFSIPVAEKDKQYFLFFEGVGSYATVWVNGTKVGNHAGGRTTFTLNITNAIKPGKTNLLAVKADHPANIRDLPWVCGGCSDEWGFSEGSQPMGIFRPVSLIITNPIRIEPFGVHIWNDTKATEKSATLNIETEIKNYSKTIKSITLVNSLYNKFNQKIAETRSVKAINPNETLTIQQNPIVLKNPELWSLDNPYLYKLISEITENGKITDAVSTSYGIRTVSWPIGKTKKTNQFLLNNKPVFINGTAEYEHNMGQSHAFSDQQIRTRVLQVKAAGYNAFRDAHQPHNLRYHANWDSLGLLWWPQFGAHIWFENPEFKANFKQLLKDWVKERRNSPSIILWGLENESTLPTGFAEECSSIIRELDPTTSSQRLITTCNGGTGTDWNVVQNWSGTYSGNPDNYGNEMKTHLLNGEYGAWRSIDLHTEGPFTQNGSLSEDRFTLLMESKIRLAESVKDSMCGQFHWLLTSHENPGRIQNGEGLREIDRLGPVNYKGLFTPWGEPTDAFYMYRSNYAPNNIEPMVYIVSHTWPNRWTTTGVKDSILVYSNCDEVELFNDIDALSLGKKKNKGIGTHFQWDSAYIQYNVLYAKGYVKGKAVATDYIVLNHLPNSPSFLKQKMEKMKSITQPEPGYNYLYRVNCGGPDYTDQNGEQWLADRHRTNDISWGSKSWTDDFPGIPAFYGSQRRTFDPIKGTTDWKLFQTFRYGRDKLLYEFPVPDGEYLVELYFIEPWYGIGGGLNCTGWRQFDIAISGKIYIHNLDIWDEAKHNAILKKTIPATIKGGTLQISFPNVLSGQAIISAIAIATKSKTIVSAPSSELNIRNLKTSGLLPAFNWSIKSWMDIGDQQYHDNIFSFNQLPPFLFGAEWIQTSFHGLFKNIDTLATFNVNAESDVFIALDSRILTKHTWMNEYVDTKKNITNDNTTGNIFKVYTKRYPAGSTVTLGSQESIQNLNLSMYSIAVVPVSRMEEAIDQRPSVRYEAENAVFYGNGLISDEFINQKYIKFSRPHNDSIEWHITPGIAGTYILKFRYINPTGKIIPVKLILIDANGIIMRNDIIEFPSNTPDKWRSLNTTTGTSINAGTYRLIISPAGLEGLGIDALEVQ